MIGRLAHLAFASAILTACSSVTVGPGTGGHGGGDTVSSSSSSGNGGAGAGGGIGTGGSGGGAACVDTNDRFDFNLHQPDDSYLDCAHSVMGMGQGQAAHIEGMVIASTATSLTIDACGPDKVCDAPVIYQLDIASPDFGMWPLDGVPVQLDVSVDVPWGCVQKLLARSLPAWGSQPSPLGPSPVFLFAGVDGSDGALPNTPFSVHTIPLGCHPGGEDCGGGPPDSFQFAVDTSLVGGQVYEGQTVPMPATDGTTPLKSILFRNLRAYNSGWCDDYWNYAWWATNLPALD